MVALLILQDEPHDQGDHRISASLSHKRILRQCTLLGPGVPLDRFEEPLDGAGRRPTGRFEFNWKAVHTLHQRRVRRNRFCAR
jgi:hypothetical protein